MENYINEFMLIAFAHFIALLSPGADFIYIVNSAINNKAKVAIGASLGIALSNAFYIMLCLFGYAAIFSQSNLLINGIKIVGGIYLLYLGLNILKTKSNTLHIGTLTSTKSNFKKELYRGFYLSFLNPKISIFYISLFTLVISKNTPWEIQLFYSIWMTLFVFIWDTLLIFLLNIKSIKKKILSFTNLEKILGSLLIIMGTGLLYSLF